MIKYNQKNPKTRPLILNKSRIIDDRKLVCISSSNAEIPPLSAKFFKKTIGEGFESTPRSIQSQALRPGSSIIRTNLQILQPRSLRGGRKTDFLGSLGIHKFASIFLFAALVLSMQANATNYTWVGPDLGSWNVNSNWNPSTNFPSSANDSAIFSGGSNIQVNVGGSFSVGSMVFSNGAYTISPTSGGTLSIGGVGSASPQISVTANNNESISTPLILHSDVTISQTGTGTLSLSGGISQSFSSYGLTIAGTGIVQSFADTYQGYTTINATA